MAARRKLAGDLLADADEAPVTRAVELSLGSGSATRRRLSNAHARGARHPLEIRPRGVRHPLGIGSILGDMSDPFNPFGDPEELQRRLAEFAEQMQGAQQVSFADNAIDLAVQMTVASIQRLNLQGTSDEQAMQVRDAIRVVFPEAVTLVREAREGLA